MMPVITVQLSPIGRSMQNHRLRIVFLACLVCVGFLLSFPAPAQTIASAPLPPEAEEAVKKGIIAAKEQEWLIAIQSFQEARKTAPGSPVVFYNLGLAESKIPGRELRAITWFGAYLTASPNAPNKAAVDDLIGGMQIKIQGNLNRLIMTVQDAAGNLPEVMPSGFFSQVMYVPALWAASGDLSAALKTANLIQDRDVKGSALHEVADVQLETGDIAGGLKTADLVQEEFFRTEILVDVANAQAKATDLAGAKMTLASALKTVSLIHDPGRMVIEEIQIAEAQRRVGDISGAKMTLTAALKIVHLDEIDLGLISKAQACAGDISGAFKTADLIQGKESKDRANDRLSRISRHLGDQGDCAEELKAELPAVSGIKTSDWLTKLDSDAPKGDCNLNTAPFLDLARYLKSLPEHETSADVLVFDLADTARTLIAAERVINGMLKQQAKK